MSTIMAFVGGIGTSEIIVIFIVLAFIVGLIKLLQNASKKNRLKEIVQNPSLDLRAPWWKRLLGFLIDYFIGVGIAGIFLYANEADYLDLSYQEKNELQNNLSITFYLFYCLISESLFRQTVGKLITCTIIKDERTLSKASLSQVILRNLCRIIPFDAFSFIRNKPKGWHDSIPGTIVVNSHNNFYVSFCRRIKLVNKGYIRIHWVISIVIGVFTFGIGFVLYWILVRLVLWIMDGFISSPVDLQGYDSKALFLESEERALINSDRPDLGRNVESIELEDDLFKIESLDFQSQSNWEDIESSYVEEYQNGSPSNISHGLNLIISKGITDIPIGNYKLEKMSKLKDDTHRVIYRNIDTDELYVIFNVDRFSELWNEDQTQLRRNIYFGFSKKSGDVV